MDYPRSYWIISFYKACESTSSIMHSQSVYPHLDGRSKKMKKKRGESLNQRDFIYIHGGRTSNTAIWQHFIDRKQWGIPSVGANVNKRENPPLFPGSHVKRVSSPSLLRGQWRTFLSRLGYRMPLCVTTSCSGSPTMSRSTAAFWRPAP